MLRGYELLEKIGEGQFGVVHRGIQPAVRREVAIKVIRPRFANEPDFIRRFEAEAQIVARLEHPQIVIAKQSAVYLRIFVIFIFFPANVTRDFRCL